MPSDAVACLQEPADGLAAFVRNAVQDAVQASGLGQGSEQPVNPEQSDTDNDDSVTCDAHLGAEAYPAGPSTGHALSNEGALLQHRESAANEACLPPQEQPRSSTKGDHKQRVGTSSNLDISGQPQTSLRLHKAHIKARPAAAVFRPVIPMYRDAVCSTGQGWWAQ